MHRRAVRSRWLEGNMPDGAAGRDLWPSLLPARGRTLEALELEENPMLRNRRDAQVVVGVDGTDASHAALIFALREGAARGSTVEVVTAWNNSQGDHDASNAALDVRALAQRAQDQALAEALTEVRSTPVISR